MDVSELKNRLRAVDSDLLALLNRRFSICRDAVDAGESEAVCWPDPAAERALLSELTEQASADLGADTVRAVYRELLSRSRALARPVAVGFFGPPGTFTHQAAMEKFGRSVRYVSCQSIPDVFDAVVREEVDCGVVPVENSTEGAVTYTLDVFLESQARICAEINLSIHQHLLARCAVSDIRVLYSHPQVFGQCRRWLRRNLPSVPLVEAVSTTDAARRCLNEPQSGALAGELASELHGLPIVVRNVEDFSHNTTRFLVLSTKDAPATGEDRTTILFAVRDRVGALYDSLQPLGRHGVSMTFIESRPSKRRSWEYVFFVDFQGHITDPNVRQALDELKEHCQFVKVLGSYPRASTVASV